jgi:hypothetical protein
MANPTEVWPSSAEVDALNDTIDAATGLPYIAKGTSPSSTPDIAEQIHRRFQRQNAILDLANKLRVVKISSTKVGGFAGDFRIGTANYSYPGETDCTNYNTLATVDGTYYLYATTSSHSGGTGKLIAGTAWPADKATFFPCATIVRTGGVIASITDMRSLGVFWAGASGSGAGTGTDETSFTLDEDNTGAAENQTELVFRRGTTAADMALRHPTGTTKLQVIANEGTGAKGDIEASQLISTITTGTKPITVASTTVCDDLNADNVDGVGFTNPPSGAGQIAYSDAANSVDFSGVGTAGDVLVSDGAAVPLWKSLLTAGIQAYHALLSAIAGLASDGFVVRTSSGTAAARTLTAGSSIAITNGDGVAADPEIAVSGNDQYCVAVGAADGSLSSLPEGDSNTVLCGNSGADPGFRQIVNDDISDAAGITPDKFGPDASGLLISDGVSAAYFPITGDVSIAEDPALSSIKAQVTFLLTLTGTHTFNAKAYLGDTAGTLMNDRSLCCDVWFGADAGSGVYPIGGNACPAPAAAASVSDISPASNVMIESRFGEGVNAKVTMAVTDGIVDLDVEWAAAANVRMCVRFRDYVFVSNRLSV